ncbi:MAG TPA: transglycosylase SLT domain-containing protein [Thermoanaerobaculia bacterium]|nr:transglycosylase SLT domain-containing protein [Thermoanaerobaculia bacterium]
MKGAGVLALWLLAVMACAPAAAVSSAASHSQPDPAPLAAPDVVPEPQPAVTLEQARALRKAGALVEYETALRTLTAAPHATTSRRARTLLALHLFDEKRDDEAVVALAAAAAADPVIAPFIGLRLTEAEARRGNPTGAINVAAQIIAAAPATSAASIARLRLPALYAQTGDSAATDAAFAQSGGVAIDELSEPEFLDLAAILSAAGRSDLASRVRMRLLRDYPQGRYTERTYGQAGAALDSLTLKESTDLAGALARVNRYDQALDLLQRIARRFPDAKTNDLYRSVRIRALFNSRNYVQLLEENRRQSLADPALLLLRARAAWRADRGTEFLAGLADLERRFPKSREANEAKVQRAKYYVTDETDYGRSTANLQKAIDGGLTGNDGENLWTLGWTFTLWEKDDEALRVFQRYIGTYPDGDYRTNSLFWSAKIHEKRGNIALRDARLRQILAEYPYNYYAYRSREILGEPTVAPAGIAGGAVFPDLDAELAKVTGVRIDAVRELMTVDLLRDASREMKMLVAEHPDNPGAAFMLADIYVQAGEPFKANGILQRRFRQFVRHGGENVPGRFWQILYPLAYWDSIRGEAERRSLDPYLLAAIIRQESGFEPTTVSNAGAVGLMQIMPQEAARIASLAGIEGITRERLFDPQENIAVGAAEYTQKLASMKGHPVLALAAYNAGQEPVGRWLARTGIDDLDLFVESIPYAETRLYVKTVTRNRYEYRRIYESSARVEQ